MLMREITYVQALREAISSEMRANPDVYIMGEDIGVYAGAFGVTDGLIQEFGPERVRDTPISEAGFVGAAIGSAVTGMRPIVEIQFSDFLACAMDQLVNQAAKLRYMFGGRGQVPLVIRTPQGSGMGSAAQHSQSLENWYAHIPGLKVVVPATAYDVKGLFKTAVADNNPVVFLEHKLLYRSKGQVPEDDYAIPFGQAAVRRAGKDVTLIAWSIEVPRALEAAEQLAAAGIDAEVIDLRTLVPLDTETIVRSVRKTGRVVIVHEANVRGGFGGEVAGVIADSDAFDFLLAPIERLGGKNVPIPFNQQLERAAVPQAEDIVQAAQRAVNW